MASVVADRPAPEAGRARGRAEAPSIEGPLRILAVVAIALVAAQLWLPMLLAGPRLDETLTTWVVSDGFDDAVVRSWRYQGQSPVYFALLWVWAQAAGTGIVALRVPTVIAMVAAGWQLRRLAEDLGIGPHRDLALAVFIGFSTVHVNAVAARPYGLLLLSVVLASRAGWRWSETGRRSDMLRWAALCAGAVYFQPFAVYALAAQGWWLVLRRRRGAPLGELAQPVVLAGAMVLPLVPQVLSLAGRQSNLAFVEVPAFVSFVVGLVPFSILFGLAVGALLSWPLDRRPELRSVAPFVVAAAFLPQIGLFAQSQLTGNGVLVAKYLTSATVGMALIAALGAAHIWRRVAVLVAAVLLVVPGVVDLDPLGSHGWSDAVDFLEAEHPDVGVLAMTGFVEATDVDFLEDSEARAYLSAPLTNHGLDAPVQVLPLGDGADHEEYVRELIERFAGPDGIAVVRAVAGVEPERLAERTLAELGYTEVDRLEPKWLEVTVWRS